MNVSPVMIHQWANGMKAVPVERAPDLERGSVGVLPCETIRPDIAWIRVPDPEWPHPGGRPCHDILGSARLREMRDAA